ncbi:hypothetical protein J2R98_001456 [Alkalibacillus filiformis]|uniref:Uncharacterized protein n=1 Tax=Alkalibacillus filiformis TaxID=200990 RepID=A0ABU0DTH5_9BACI|nr:hypothetical protein [Alkalibacillus filiformis]MDQ0351639.1 hypothetical protein [Alkalibacillus filiformis]
MTDKQGLRECLFRTRIQKVLLGVSVVLILALIAGYYFFTSHPAMQYAEIEQKTVEQLTQYTNQYTQEEHKLMNSLSNTSSQSDFVIKGNVNSSSGGRQIDTIRSLLLSSEISGTRFLSPNTSEVSYDFQLKAMGIHLMDGMLYQNEGYTQFQADWLPHVYGVKNRLELPNAEDYFIEVPEWYDPQSNWFERHSVTQSSERYGLMFAQLISDLNFDVEELAGDQRKLTVKLPEQEANLFLSKVVENVKANDEVNEDLLNTIEKVEVKKDVLYEAVFNNQFVKNRELFTVIEYEEELYDVHLSLDTFLKEQSFEAELVLQVESQNSQQKFEVRHTSSGVEEGNRLAVDQNVFVQYDFNQVYDAARLNWHTIHEDGLKQTDFELYIADDSIQNPLQGKLTNEYRSSDQSGAHNTYINIIIGEELLGQRDIPFNEIELSIERDINFVDDVDVPTIDEEETYWIEWDVLYELERLFHQAKSIATDEVDELIREMWPF